MSERNGRLRRTRARRSEAWVRVVADEPVEKMCKLLISERDRVLARVLAIAALGIDVAAARMTRRRFAYTCVDWSERRPHLGGALAAALLKLALARKWVLQDPDGRALHVTVSGRRELAIRFGLQV